MDINGIRIDVESGQLSVRIGTRAMSEPRYLPKAPDDVQALVDAILDATGCRLIGNEVVNTEAYRAQLLDELARESVMSDDEYNAAKP